MKQPMIKTQIPILILLLVVILLLGLPTKAATLNNSSFKNQKQAEGSGIRDSRNLENTFESELYSEVEENMERISQYGGWVRNFHITGNRATMCVNVKIEILEFSVFGNPSVTGQTFLPGQCEVLVSSNDYAYVAGDYFDAYGIIVFNISNPQDIQQADFITVTGPVKELLIDGEYLYVNNNASVIIYSLINPAEPLYLGTYYSGYGSRISSIAVSNNYLYAAKGTNGLTVIDVSDKSNPNQVSTFPFTGSASSVAIISNYAFVSDNTEATVNGLQLFDVTNPLLPVLYDLFALPASQKISASGAVAYVISDNLYLLDISNPTNPIVASTLELPYLVELTGNKLYKYRFAGNSTYFSLDFFSEEVVSNPYQPDQVSLYKFMNGAWGISKKDNHAFFASDSDGLHVVNISDPKLPYWVSSVDLPGRAMSVTINGDYAYVSSGPDGLNIVDISSPDFPSFEGQYDPTGSVSDAEIIGDLAFLAAGSDGLIIINISNPANPTFVGQYNTSGNAGRLDVNGDFAYITDDYNGLNIINISNPSSPYFVDSFDTTFRAANVLVSENVVYLTDIEGEGYSNGWLRIIDISNPAQPTQLGVVAGVDITDLTKEENILFGTDYFGYLRAYDVTNPSQPLEIGFSHYYPPLWGLEVDQSIIYAVGYYGMYVVNYTGGAGGEPFDDVRQAGDITLSGNLEEGGTVFMTIPVKNYGTAPSPPIHPYTEGYTSLNQLWRADGAQPSAKIINPGETVNFTVLHDLWYGHVGRWTTYGAYLWNDASDSYIGELVSNGFNQNIEFDVVASGGGSGTPTPTPIPTPIPDPKRAWTIMYYYAADNDLDDDVYLEIPDLLKASKNSDIYIPVFIDQKSAGSKYEAYVDGKKGISILKPELNSGDPNTLTNFIKWAKGNYPADRYALVIIGHGNGLSGIARDESSNEDRINPQELRMVLQNSGSLDVLYLEACLMANLESTYQVRGLVDYYVASESKGYIPRDHSSYLVDISRSTDPYQLAEGMANSYFQEYTEQWNPDNYPSSVSIADMSKIEDVVQAANALGNEILTHVFDWGDVWQFIVGDEVQRFDTNGDRIINNKDSLGDLYHFAQLIEGLGVQDLTVSANNLKTAIDNYIKYNNTWSARDQIVGQANRWDLSNANGVSIAIVNYYLCYYSGGNYDFAGEVDWYCDQPEEVKGVATGGWGQMLSELVSTYNPNGIQVIEPPPLLPLEIRVQNVYIPLIQKP